MKKTSFLISVILFASFFLPGACREQPAARWASAAGGLELRDAPSAEGKVIARIPNRAEVMLLEETAKTISDRGTVERWSRVEYRGITGWAFGETLSASPPAAVSVAFLRATSFLPDDGQPWRFHPINAFDDDPETAWCEGAAGPGIDEVIGIVFREPVTADALAIVPGRREGSPRLKSATLSLGGVVMKAEFPDESKPLTVNFSTPETFSQFALRIDAVYEGTEPQDTSVSEIGFFLDGHPVRIDGPGTAARVRSQSGFLGTFPGSGNVIALADLKGGGFIVASDTAYDAADDGNGRDVTIVRTDGRGAPVWTKTLSWEGNDAPVGIHETRDSGFIVCTAEFLYDQYFGENIRLTKIDARGDQLWSHAVDEANAFSVGSCRETADGNFVLCGSALAGDDGQDVRLIKYDTNGSKLFAAAVFKDEGVVRPNSVRETADGSFLIGGFTDGCAGGCFRAWICKADARGRLLWKTDVSGGARLPKILDVREAPDGGYVGCGFGFSEAGPPVPFLAKLDRQGGEAWSKIIPLEGANEAYRFDIFPDGSLAVAGRAIGSENTKGAGWLMTLNDLGEIIHRQGFPHLDARLDFKVIRARDGGFLIAGAESVPAGSWPKNFRVIKTDEFGTIIRPAPIIGK